MVETLKRSQPWGIQSHGGCRAGAGTPTIGGTAAGTPAIGGESDEVHKAIGSPILGGNALAIGNGDHDEAPAAGGVDNAEVLVDLGYRLLGKSIGQGAYGAVFPVMWKNGSSEAGSELAVVKHIEHSAAGPSGVADREVEILMQLKHPHVIRLIQAIQTPFARDLIFEYCSCDLRTAMKPASGGGMHFTLEPLERITRQLCNGLAYLHEKEIVHRDLKPANVLVQESGSSVNVKIGDFGLARRVSDDMPATGGCSAGPPHMTTGMTTLWYRAPEALLGSQRYGTAVDMWALGCVCVELEGKVIAFPGSSEESMVNKLCSTMGTLPAPGGSPWMALTMLPKYTQLVKAMGKRKAMSFPWKVKEQCEEFLKKVFIPCPSLRFSAKDSLTLPYLLATGSGSEQPPIQCSLPVVERVRSILGVVGEER